MKDAAIIISAFALGGALIYLAIFILPFLVAMAFVVLIYWMVAKAISGRFQ